MAIVHATAPSYSAIIDSQWEFGPDLEARWVFSEITGNVADTSGNGHTAVENGTVPAQTGKFGSGARGPFSDSNFLLAPDVPSIRVQPPFSVAVWAYYPSLSLNQYAKICGKEYNTVGGAEGYNGSWMLNAAAAGAPTPILLLEGRTGPLAADNVAWAFLPGTPPANHWPLVIGWHHIGFSFAANGDLRMYLDGVLSREVPGALAGKTIHYDSTGFYFGKDGTFGGSSWNGWLDDVAVYNAYKDAVFFDAMWRTGSHPTLAQAIAPSFSERIESQWAYDVGADVVAPSFSEDTTQDDPNTWVLLEQEFITDNKPPELQNLSPYNGETNVDAHTNIDMEIVDTESDVDPASVVLHVNGALAWSGDSQQYGFQVAKTRVPGIGYRYVINPFIPLPTGSTVYIGVYAKDLSVNANILNTSYHFDTEATELPVILNVTPADGAVDVDPFATLEFDLTDLNDDVLPSGTVVMVNGVRAVDSGQGANGFVAVITKITDGYHYVVGAPRAYTYGSVVSVDLHGEDYVGSTVDVSLSFTIAPSDICFEGPLTVFEDLLLQPFAEQPALEQIRLALLTNLVGDFNMLGAARGIYLRTYETDLFPMLARLVPTPTDAQRNTHLCTWVPAVQVYNTLQLRLPRLFEVAIRELSALSLPREYTDTMRRYARIEDEATVLINLACFLVVMGKALTNPDLV